MLIPLVHLTGAEIAGKVTVTPAPTHSPVMISPYARNRYRPPTSVSSPEADVLENIIIYLDEHPSLRTIASAEDNPIIDQKNLMIVPHVTPIVVGTTVHLLNSDDVYHNIFSLSRPKRFNLGRYPRGEYRAVTFERPGIVEIFCDIHSEMNAVILVLPNSYFTTALLDGTYRIPDIPPGTYVVKVWQEKDDGASKTVTIPAMDSIITLNFQL
jgi:plastocyanin